MFRGRSISKGLCIAGLLMAIVAAVAPAAYGGEDIALDDTAATVPAVGTAVTEVTESAPSVEDATGAAGSATGAVAGTAEAPVEATTGVVEEPAPAVASTSSGSSAPTANTVESAAADLTSSAGDAGSELPTSGGTASSSTAPDASGGSPGAPAASGSSAEPVSSSPQQGRAAMSIAWDGPAARAPFRSVPRAFLAAAKAPEKLLDELLGIGNTVGLDDVKGVRVTRAQGEAEEPATSAAPTSAPLAFTGIAIGAVLAIGLVLLAAGSGVRSAGRVTTA